MKLANKLSHLVKRFQALEAEVRQDEKLFMAAVAPRLLSQTATARRLGLSISHVRRMDGALRPIRVEGGARVYPADHVERVAAKRQSTT